MENLVKIQAELKAPKGQYNNYGGYKYRSAEDILEAAKPLLAKYNALLTLSDCVKEIGDRIYIQATATYTELGTAGLIKDSIAITAYAREPLSKKGMDDSQITGTASSYARKYALNGLFLIDDAKDADTDEYTRQTRTDAREAASPRKLGKDVAAEIESLIDATASDRGKLLNYYKVNDIKDLTAEQAADCMSKLKKKLR